MPLVPLVKQSTNFSCAAACFASILNYWGKWQVDEKDLYDQLHTTKDGTTSRNILNEAKDFEFRTVAYKRDLTIDNLKNLCRHGYTVILSVQGGGKDKSEDWTKEWSDGHYIVLVDVREDSILAMDSWPGEYVEIPMKQFEDRWHDYSDSGKDKEYRTGIILRG